MKTICRSYYWMNGNKQCAYQNTTGCRANSDVECGLLIEEKESNPSLLQGWICPRCGMVHSPFSTFCGCPPQSFTSANVTYQPQEAKQPERTAEEILLAKFPLLPKSSNKEGMDKIIEAMQEYSEQSCDHIHNLFSIPAEKLKPLEELYRKEHPKDGFYIPDATEFYTWIAEKVMKFEKTENNN